MASATSTITTPETSEQRVLSKRSRKKSRTSQVLICISDCKYDVVREAAQAKGWKLINDDPEASTSRKCHVYWIDVPAIVERMQHLQRWQRINHFPGMSNVARKGRLAQNLDRMRRAFPQEYSFYPRTWVLPVEWGAFKAEFDANGKTARTFIIKPDSGCQGRGIFLTQDLNRVNAMESQVAQLYVQKPLLIEGFKFDVRLYVLVTSVIPLRIYAFKDGLTRFCTEEYTRPSGDNLGQRCMHLTNYAVNKGSENFVANDHADRDDLGSKRSLRWLLGWIAAERGGQEKADALWRKMGGAITKTLISVMPTLHREYLHTFGPDNNHEQHPVSVVPSGSSSEGPPQGGGGGGGGAAGSIGMADGTYCSGGATARHDATAITVDVSGDNFSRPQREDDPKIESARATEDSSYSPGEGGIGTNVAKGEEVTPPPVTLGNTTGAKESPEGHCGRAGGADDGIQADPLEEDRIVGEEANPTNGAPDPSPNTCGGNIDASTNNLFPGGVAGDTGAATAGDREGVVEGSRCVEILGFDFMIDAALKPWLIEVNHLPSFATDSPLDRRIKAQVVSTALSVLHAKANDRKSFEESAKRDAQNRLYNNENMAAATAQREKERKNAEAAVAKIRRKLEAIYMRFAPHKLGKVGGLLARYAGDEEKLLRIVRRKYVVDTDKRSRDCAAGESSESIAAPSGDAGNGGLKQTDRDQSSKIAPVHGSEAAGDIGQLPVSMDNPSKEQISVQDNHSVVKEEHGGSLRGKLVPPKIWSPDARILHPPEDTGEDSPAKEGGSGGGENRAGSRSLPASSSSWYTAEGVRQQHDLEALSREAEILEGWERLYPPPDKPAPVRGGTPSPSVGSNSGISGRRQESKSEGADVGTSGCRIGDGDGGGNATNCGGGGGGGGGREQTAKGGRKRRKPAAAVELMIQRAFEDDWKMTLRLKCPLQQQRGGVMDPPVQSTTRLPQVGGGRQPAAAAAAANQQNDGSNKSSSSSSSCSNRSAPPAVLGPEQREKAQRLMEGYSSSRRSSSAPSRHSSAGADGTPPPYAERSKLPASLRIAVLRAKEWRRRRDEGNARRHSGTMAVKMHTFDFGVFSG